MPLRLAADFENFKRRSRQESEARATGQKESFIVELLSVIDNLERALAASASRDVAQFHQGVEMTLNTLDEVLKGAMRSIAVRRTNARTGRDETETYQVRIPKGVQASQSIRVADHGGEGSNGGVAGDIYLRVRYAEPPDWQVRGSDLLGHLCREPD